MYTRYRLAAASQHARIKMTLSVYEILLASEVMRKADWARIKSHLIIKERGIVARHRKTN